MLDEEGKKKDWPDSRPGDKGRMVGTRPWLAEPTTEELDVFSSVECLEEPSIPAEVASREDAGGGIMKAGWEAENAVGRSLGFSGAKAGLGAAPGMSSIVLAPCLSNSSRSNPAEGIPFLDCCSIGSWRLAPRTGRGIGVSDRTVASCSV